MALTLSFLPSQSDVGVFPRKILCAQEWADTQGSGLDMFKFCDSLTTDGAIFLLFSEAISFPGLWLLCHGSDGQWLTKERVLFFFFKCGF